MVTKAGMERSAITEGLSNGHITFWRKPKSPRRLTKANIIVQFMKLNKGVHQRTLGTSSDEHLFFTLRCNV